MTAACRINTVPRAGQISIPLSDELAASSATGTECALKTAGSGIAAKQSIGESCRTFRVAQRITVETSRLNQAASTSLQ